MQGEGRNPACGDVALHYNLKWGIGSYTDELTVAGTVSPRRLQGQASQHEWGESQGVPPLSEDLLQLVATGRGKSPFVRDLNPEGLPILL